MSLAKDVENDTNTKSFGVGKMSEYFWVPEQAIFDYAEDATEFMDLGPGCLVASHVAYDSLKAREAQLLEAIRVMREELKHISQSEPACSPCRGYFGDDLTEHFRESSKKALKAADKILNPGGVE